MGHAAAGARTREDQRRLRRTRCTRSVSRFMRVLEIVLESLIEAPSKQQLLEPED